MNATTAVGGSGPRGRCCPGAVLLGAAPRHDLHRVGAEELADCLPVALPPETRDRAARAVHKDDGAVAEAGEVLDGQGHAAVVRRADDVDPGRAQAASDGDDGVLRSEGGQRSLGQPRSEQQQRLTAEVEQRLDGPALPMGAGQGAHDDVIAASVGSDVYLLEQLGVEGAADVHRHAEELGAAPGEQAGGAVRAVADRTGRLEHRLAGLRARAGLSTQHQRGRRRGHSRSRGDVLQARADWTRRHTAPL